MVMGDYTWVQRVRTVDAIDRNDVLPLEVDPAWRLLHVATGSGGQTTLTYGWPWPPIPVDYVPPFATPAECDHEGPEPCSRCCSCVACSEIRRADLDDAS